MSRPAPLVSRRPLAAGPVVTGGTSLGTPLKTRTVITTVQAEAAMAAPAAAGPSTPARARAAPASSPLAARTPAKTPLRGFGSSVASTTVAAASSSSAAAAPAASPASSSVRRPSPSPKMISRQRYDANKTKDPFSAKTKFKTAFGEAYANGSVPCRINHGSVHQYLQWDRPASELDYAQLLPALADGLRETEHPHVVIARKAFAELLAEGGQARVAPLLPRLVQPLRAALLDPAPGVFAAACTAIGQLSDAVGPLLNPHLDLLLQQINKKSMQKQFAETVNACISKLADNGGDEAIPKIKSKVPGFCI